MKIVKSNSRKPSPKPKPRPSPRAPGRKITPGKKEKITPPKPWPKPPKRN